MWNRTTVKKECQLYKVTDGATGKVVNEDELKATIDLISAALTEIYGSGRAANVSLTEVKGEITEVKVQSFPTP